MSNEQSPAEEVPQEQPVIEPKGPDFGGPGYESAPRPEPFTSPAPSAGEVQPPADHPGADPAPAPLLQQSPGPQPAPVQTPQPAPGQVPGRYDPPPAAPVPVVERGAQPPSYGYGNTDPYGYGAGGGYPQPYYQPHYGYQMQHMQPEHPSSVTTLVLGLVGIFVPILSPIAWITGSNARRSIRDGAPYRWSGTGMTGYVLGITFTIIHGLFWALVFLAAMAG